MPYFGGAGGGANFPDITDVGGVVTIATRSTFDDTVANDNSTNFFDVTGTMPTTPTGPVNGIEFNITGAGSFGDTNQALLVNYIAGNTGVGISSAINATNAASGPTSTFIQFNVGSYGVKASAGNNAVANGLAFGIAGDARASNAIGVAVGVFGGTVNSGTNAVGVAGMTANGSTVSIGVLAALSNAYARTSLTSTALLVDNGAVAAPIAIFRDNGTDVVVIPDGTGYVQQKGARSSLASNYTNATTTFSNTALSITVVSGRKYAFRAALFIDNSTAIDGGKLDFNGGTATATDFRAHAVLSSATGTTLAQANAASTALATVINATTFVGTTQCLWEVSGTFEPSGSGTFILRAAENSTSTGTLTIRRGSYIHIEDMP